MKISSLTVALILPLSAAASDLGSMMKSFNTPPDSARTKVWWFHGEQAPAHEGITADLEAYRAAGVGGVVYYDQVHGKGEGAPELWSPAWWDALTFSALEARRLGLSFEINVGNGYVAGGSHITPETAMKRIAMADTIVNSGNTSLALPLPPEAAGWYSDVAVLAVPVSEDPVVTHMLTGKTVAIKEAGMSDTVMIDSPMTARAITYTTNGRAKAATLAMNYPGPPAETFYGCGYRELPPIGRLEASTDGGATWDFVADLPARYRNHGGVKPTTVSFPPVQADRFRIILTLPEGLHPADRSVSISDITLTSDALVDNREEKAALRSDYITPGTIPSFSPGEVIASADIIDLTPLAASGSIDLSALPEGRWRVMRFVAVPTGGRTKHGRRKWLGLECDKLHPSGARTQWDYYVRPVVDSLRRAGADVKGVIMDSHEAGPQNWCADLPGQFENLRGYALLPWLPAMVGLVVDSTEATEQFLSDLRRTLSDLAADRYFGELDRLALTDSLMFTAQAVGGALCLTADNIDIKRSLRRPQGEFWAYQTGGSYDIKDCSSAAHQFGRRVASGEAFTDATYAHSPTDIKNLADYAFSFGINEFVVCASAYQPTPGDRPGNTANGRQYCLNRANTYWPLMRPMWDSQARCSWLLRQGEPVVDAAVYLGDDVPERIRSHRLPPLPQGYDFDAVTTGSLLSMKTAGDGRLHLPSGMSYSVVVLPRDTTRLPSKVIDAIGNLRRNGAKIIPWADAALLATPDVTYPAGDSIFFCHRRTPDADIYFLNNHQDKRVDTVFSFASPRQYASLWHPADGSVTRIKSSGAAVDLHFAPRESYFVVFSDSPIPGIASETPSTTRTLPVTGPWKAWFDPAMGGPGNIVVDTLADYTLSEEPGIRYFSGIAEFTTDIDLDTVPAIAILDLGETRDPVEVIVNGHRIRTLWCSPMTADIASQLHAGTNTLTLRVANSLYNRMIYDASLPEPQRITRATTPVVTHDTPLVSSGILTPPVLHLP